MTFQCALARIRGIGSNLPPLRGASGRRLGGAGTLLVLATALALVLPVGAPAQQTSDGASTGASAAESDREPPVPQTFDWWSPEDVSPETSWGQPVDTAATRRILSWTTREEFTTPLVDHLPDHPDAVSPSDHFGHPIGRPGTLHSVDQIHGYFESLAASSPRVTFDVLGETEEGRSLALALVGSEGNLERLDEVRAGMGALADPRVTSEAEAERLIDELPVVYLFYAGLHSPETGPPEMVMEMAYRLAASDAPTIREIRDDVVVAIVPVVEPDGRDRVVQWHDRHNRDVFDPDDEVPGPPYWGAYIRHDNNRDGLQMSLRLTQILVDLALDWHFPVVHDLHESVPFLYTSTGTGPYNPTIDPIAVSEWTWFANYEVTALTSEGLPGVWTHGFYDGWYPGYLMWVTGLDLNGLGRFYETFGNGVPHTMEREVGGATEVEWYRPNPAYEETLWSLRNNTNYMQTGALTALSLVARHRERVLRQYWTKTKNSLRKGRTEAPHAWVVPADQERRADAAYMLDLLRRHGIELHRASDGGTFAAAPPSGVLEATGPEDSVTVAAGDYLVRMDQPLRNYALTLLRRQEFPEGAPTPYDDVAWTFPLMHHVDARAVTDSAVLALESEPVGRAPVMLPGLRVGADAPDWWAVETRASSRTAGAYFRLAAEVEPLAADSAFTVDERAFPAGTWLVPGPGAASPGGVDAARLEQLWREGGLRVTGLDDRDVEGVPRHPMDPPRVLFLHTWRNTQDGGSVRYALDQLGVPYDYEGVHRLSGQDGWTGNDLRDRWDVILIPSQGGGSDGREIFQGVDSKGGPLAYTRTDLYPTHGFPDAAEDITGGFGYEGLAALTEFVRSGGTLVTLGSASTLPLDLGMVREVERDEVEGLYVPGSLVRGEVARNGHPLTYGYPDTMPLYHRFGPYLDVDEDDDGGAAGATTVLRYGEAEDLLLSGYASDPGGLSREPALAVAPLGEGVVVLFGFDPMHRYQNHGNFAFVWNALFHWNDLRATPGS